MPEIIKTKTESNKLSRRKGLAAGVLACGMAFMSSACGPKVEPEPTSSAIHEHRMPPRQPRCEVVIFRAHGSGYKWNVRINAYDENEPALYYPRGYSIDFGDGTTPVPSDGGIKSHTFTRDGDYVVKAGMTMEVAPGVSKADTGGIESGETIPCEPVHLRVPGS